jgi:hypothetical protein
VLGLGQFGCGIFGPNDPCKDPADCGGPPPPPPAVYPPRDSPVNAVEYLRVSWQERDSTRADSVLAADYQGTSTEVGSSPSTLSFVKSDEIRALHNFKDDNSVTKVTMDFGPTGSWIPEIRPDHPDWVVVPIRQFTILINRNSGSDDAVSSSNSTTIEFKTRPVTSGSQTLWEVVRWTEVHTE